MNAAPPRSGLQLHSRITGDGHLEASLIETAVAPLEPDEVLVRIEAAPINPSDLGLLLGAADPATIRAAGSPGKPAIRADVPIARRAAMTARLDQSLPVGNEGAGVVIAAGASPEAQALRGKTVGIYGGATYAQYRAIKAADALVLPDGVTAAQGASNFVNPMTALGMLETLRHEGHTALVHTAAASNLGVMLNRLCITDGVPLVNIVRSTEQERLLRDVGATVICNSSAATFSDDLAQAIATTGATLAFDAIGGGALASQILRAMEAAASATATIYSRYGSYVHKQVYIYGGLDSSPTVLDRSYGMAWGVGGWLVFPYLQKLGPDVIARLRARVGSEITTTFASRYTREVSLTEALDPAIIAQYNKRATGEKFLIVPTKSDGLTT